MIIRPAEPSDSEAIWSIIGPTFRAGETYPIDPTISQPDGLAYWLAPDKETFVAMDNGDVVGTYYLRANRAGGGGHVANCGYMTAARAMGRGVARRMCEHSMERASGRGFRAMQFNFVVSTNERAVALWKSCGFEVVGRLPLAFHHPQRGYVDALVMFQPMSS